MDDFQAKNEWKQRRKFVSAMSTLCSLNAKQEVKQLKPELI